MSNTILEIIRSKHEEIEQLEKALAKGISYKEKNPKERVFAEMIIKKCIDRIQNLSKELIRYYEDESGLFKEENLVLLGKKHYLDSTFCLLKKNNINSNKKKVDVWVNFYEKLKEIKQTNKRQMTGNDVNENITGDKIFNKYLDEVNNKSNFSIDENKGNCVDMYTLYQQFINIKGIYELNNEKDIDYLSYINSFGDFEKIPIKIKLQSDYQDYIKNCCQYLKEFFIKIQPLANINEIQDIIDSKFDNDWENREIPGWEGLQKEDESINDKKENENKKESNNNNIQDNNTNIENIKDNDTNIKTDKNENPSIEIFYCEICQKSFSKKTVFEYHLKSKKHLKKQSQKEKDPSSFPISKYENLRSISYYEFQISKYKDLLNDIIQNTKNQIRKKQTMNYIELEADIINENEIKKLEITESDTKKIYNPKNIPIGWDGKPIPYWLYKIHGLGVEYKCEICGGASYWGRRSFEHHFQEWRHAAGMKSLKLPNTLQFKEVTTIEDALRLQNKLLEDQKKEEFKPEYEEEFEDENGNLVNRTMLLKRQREENDD